MAIADSPVMQQYRRIKAEYGHALVMFRMGDFYEMLGDDALVASEILKITLTKRRTAQAGDEGTPMCGVPYHAAEGYIGKLLEANWKVALVEQVETPEEAKKARGSGAIVRREVVRLFTPGTLTEETYLPAEATRHLVAFFGQPDPSTPRVEGAVAWMDMSTGDVGVRMVTQATLASVLASLSVGEGVTPPETETVLTQALAQNGQDGRRLVTVHPGLFTPQAATAAVARGYGLADTRGLGLPEEMMLRAVGGLIGYAELTQMGKLPRLKVPSVVSASSRLTIDPRTRRNLELTESLAGRRADSLLGVLDACTTAAGARLLARWVAEPLTDLAAIAARQDAVAAFVAAPTPREALRNSLKQTGDVARCVSRLLLGRGAPRDLGVLRATGHVLPALAAELAKLAPTLPPLLAQHRQGLLGLARLTATLSAALADDPLPALIRDGGFIKDGFDAELDQYRALVTNGNTLLEALERKETELSGMAPKLRYNQVWGYYLEVTKTQLEGAGQTPPAHWVHRQTTTQSHRYTTPDLMALERDLGSAGARTQRREEEILATLVEAVKAASTALLDASEALATVDVLATLAHIAQRHGWVRPLVDASDAFDIENGQHPVVSARVSDFIPNSCALGGGQLWLLTGPNMAGKSTFLRQNALILILAQMGAFVPATKAHIGVADAVFSRIGAADDLAAGQSTFMVEMIETAQILNRATPKSLVILDELGRGTATYDGLAIAWACVEDITRRLNCRTLFATHYHELTALEGQIPNVSCWQVTVKEWKGDIVFLHKVEKGAAAGSYGVQVAKLAGVPTPVVGRAAELLAGFTKTAKSRGVMRVDELSLFATPITTATPQDTPLETRLKGVDVDALTAREALQVLYDLKTLA